MGLFSHLGHFFHDVGHAISHAAHDVEHAVSHVANSVGHTISHVAHDIEHGLAHFAHEVEHTVSKAAHDAIRGIRHAIADGGRLLGKIEHVVGAPLRFVVGGIAHAVGDLIGVHMRTLTAHERATLMPIFGNTLPYNQILLTSIAGKDGRAFTIPGSMVLTASALIPVLGPVIALGGLIEHLQDKYLINVGKAAYGNMFPSAYDNSFGEKAGSELVHESTHVWQGVNNAFSWGYVFNSLYSQFRCGQHAYDVDESNLKDFESYNVEQQATLVEHWYSRDRGEADRSFAYIRDNIRTGDPDAHTRLP
jgi:hypothetical protein